MVNIFNIDVDWVEQELVLIVVKVDVIEEFDWLGVYIVVVCVLLIEDKLIGCKFDFLL